MLFIIKILLSTLIDDRELGKEFLILIPFDYFPISFHLILMHPKIDPEPQPGVLLENNEYSD